MKYYFSFADTVPLLPLKSPHDLLILSAGAVRHASRIRLSGAPWHPSESEGDRLIWSHGAIFSHVNPRLSARKAPGRSDERTLESRTYENRMAHKYMISNYIISPRDGYRRHFPTTPTQAPLQPQVGQRLFRCKNMRQLT
jgi:hypothetical protein